jgi:hypothetical protein
VTALFRRALVERDIDEEFRFHVEMQERAFRDAGMSAAEARRAAVRRFGGIPQVREAAWDQRGWPSLDRLGQDVRYAARILSRSPTFALVALLSLGLGIGATAAVFSLLNAVLFRPLPVPSPGNLRVVCWQGQRVEISHYSGSGRRQRADGAVVTASFPYPTYLDFRDTVAGLGDAFAYARLASATVVTDGTASTVEALMVSGNYFSAYGADALVGRVLPLTGVRTQAEQIWSQTALERMFAWLGGFVALLALLLSCIGLHGLMAYDVTRRTGEIGVRIALGACPTAVARKVVWEALATAAVGIALGAAGAVAFGRVVESRLFGVTPRDPVTLGVSALLLIAVAAVSAYVPARQASRVDPQIALRAE